MFQKSTEVIKSTISTRSLSVENLSCVDSIAMLTKKFSISCTTQILFNIKDKKIREIVGNMFKNAYKIVTFEKKQTRTDLTCDEMNECISATNQLVDNYETLIETNNSETLSTYTFDIDTSNTSNIDTARDLQIEELESRVKQLTDENAELKSQLDVYKSKEQEKQQIERELDKFFVNHHEKSQRIHSFVELITGANSVAITTHINNLISDGYMDGNMIKKELHDVLSSHHLYKCTYNTFSVQVQAKHN